MAFTKVTDPVDNITNQPNQPIIGATALKALFDEIGKDLKTYINDTLIEELESTTNGDSGADNIGTTPVGSGVAENVQGVLEELDAKIDTQLPTPDGSITDAKLSNISGQIKSNVTDLSINVKSYYLGSHPDWTIAFKAVIALIKANGSGRMLIPPGTYSFSEKLLIDFDNIFIDARGANLTYTGFDDWAIECTLGSGNVFYDLEINGLTVRKSTETWASNINGIRVVNANTCNFSFGAVNFKVGVQFEGFGQGSVFNVTRLLALTNNETNLLLTANATGWCNDNTFIGGAMSFFSGRGGGYVGTTNVRIDDTTLGLNNNRFYGISFESASADTVAVDCGGLYNMFESCRYEVSTKINFGVNSNSNVIHFGRGADVSNVTDLGTRNKLFTRNKITFSGGTTSATDPSFTFKNAGSATYPAIGVLDPTTGVAKTLFFGDGNIQTAAVIRALRFELGDGALAGRSRFLQYVVGSPEGSITASPGSLAVNGNGGAGTTLWVKETGTGNTGWVAK